MPWQTERVSEEIKRAFDRARSRVEESVRGTPPEEVVRQHADAVDEILVAAFERALDSSGHAGAGVALVALGGYGRRELTTGSDLDLLLLHRGWTRPDITELNRSLMYPLWDAGRELGDRAREPRDVFRSLERVDEAAALLDARLLAGDEGLFTELHTSVIRRLERGRASFFKQLVEASSDRHGRFGHAGHLLEPNLRDSAGGLRDVHTLWWASKLLPGADGLDGLVATGLLSELDRGLVDRARSFLLGVRIQLHLLTERHQDQLYLPDQDEIARRLGYGDDGAPADPFMQELYAHARHIDAIVSSFWERAMHRKPRRLWRSTASNAVGDGCVVQEGRLEVVAVTHPRDDPAGWLRVFRRSIRGDVPLGRGSLNRLQESVTGAELRWTPEARQLFLEILQSGDEGVRALEAMDAAGFLAALVPQWEGVRCLPQRDHYHRFTVDMHLFAVVAELASSRSSEDSDVRDAWARVSDTEALFLGALLHDVGKGRGGDHSDIGTHLAADAARRMGLEPAQLDDVEFLVREHLMLAMLATQRDLNERRTIAEAAARAGDPSRLAMLFLLTRADSLSTGPEAWSRFRAMLVRELYTKTMRVLEGKPEAVEEAASRELSLLGSALDQAEVRTSVIAADEAHEFVVVAHDRPGLFATVCGVLALRGIDVHDAEIYTRADGIAVEIFRVVGAHGDVPEERWGRVQADIRAALAGELDLDDALGRKTAQLRRRRVAKRPAPGRVVVDNRASDTHTVVEVHTEDRLGLLREITKTLYEAGCDLSLAKVATYGADVVDVFYVRDLEGSRITDEGHLRRIEAALRRLFPSGG